MTTSIKIDITATINRDFDFFLIFMIDLILSYIIFLLKLNPTSRFFFQAQLGVMRNLILKLLVAGIIPQNDKSTGRKNYSN